MFHSITYGDLEFKDVHKKILEFMEADSESRYRIIIGADSQEKQISRKATNAVLNQRSSRAPGWKPAGRGKSGSSRNFKSEIPTGNARHTDFVTAIIVHRVGAGGIYFWQRKVDKTKRVLRQRIYEEAFMALQTAQEILESFKQNGIKSYELEIHVDIGKKGPTREIINEVVGMIRGSGFNVKTKPEAYGASKVADRHT